MTSTNFHQKHRQLRVGGSCLWSPTKTWAIRERPALGLQSYSSAWVWSYLTLFYPSRKSQGNKDNKDSNEDDDDGGGDDHDDDDTNSKNKNNKNNNKNNKKNKNKNKNNNKNKNTSNTNKKKNNNKNNKNNNNNNNKKKKKKKKNKNKNNKNKNNNNNSNSNSNNNNIIIIIIIIIQQHHTTYNNKSYLWLFRNLPDAVLPILLGNTWNSWWNVWWNSCRSITGRYFIRILDDQWIFRTVLGEFHYSSHPSYHVNLPGIVLGLRVITTPNLPLIRKKY